MTQIHDLIQSIQGNQIGSSKKQGALEETSSAAPKSFGDTMSDFLNVVNQNSKESASQVAEVVKGNSDDIAQAMMTMEESKLSFQLMIEIRTKLLESYQEISRMQV